MHRTQRRAGLLAGCSASAGDGAGAGSAADFRLEAVEELATGLESPWSVVFVGSSALISERDTGRIVERTADGEMREAGRITGVVHGGEGGLLGLAVDDERRLFVYSTGPDGNRVQRLPLTGEPGSLGLGDAVTLIDGIPSAGIHNGGRLAIGPDDLLYVTTGDAASGGASQDRESLAGKILRLTLDGDVPDDNPFPGSPVFTLGHRNPQGLAWTSDGTLYAAEFGQNTWDELNRIEPGANYGWPEVEGVADEGDFVDPVQQWATDEASPSGMTAVDDRLLVANLRGRSVRAVPASDPAAQIELFADEYGRIRHVAAAPDGSVWILTSNTDGRGNPSDGDDRILRAMPAETAFSSADAS